MITKVNGIWRMYLLYCHLNGYNPSHYNVLKAWLEGTEPKEGLK